MSNGNGSPVGFFALNGSKRYQQVADATLFVGAAPESVDVRIRIFTVANGASVVPRFCCKYATITDAILADGNCAQQIENTKEYRKRVDALANGLTFYTASQRPAPAAGCVRVIDRVGGGSVVPQIE